MRPASSCKLSAEPGLLITEDALSGVCMRGSGSPMGACVVVFAFTISVSERGLGRTRPDDPLPSGVSMKPLDSGVIICKDERALIRALLLPMGPCSPSPAAPWDAVARCVSEWAEELRDIVGLVTNPCNEVMDPEECIDASELDEMFLGIGCASGICMGAPGIPMFMPIDMGTGMAGSPISNLTWSCGCTFFFLPRFPRGCGLVCILLCLVSSSLRLNRFVHPGKSHAWGFSPVCVRMCLVWCSRRWNALPQTGHMCGRGASFLGGVVDIIVWYMLSSFCCSLVVYGIQGEQGQG